MTMTWYFLDPRMTPDRLGYIPTFFDEDDPRPAAEQVDEKYIGGWRPHDRWRRLENGTLGYPGDPPMKPLAYCWFRQELLQFYPHAYLSIVQPDGSFEVSRLD